VHLGATKVNGKTPVEVDVFMCSSPPILLLNLEGRADARALVRAVGSMLMKGEPAARFDRTGGQDRAPVSHGELVTRITPNGNAFQGKERAGQASN
jgi:hypothetical protein